VTVIVGKFLVALACSLAIVLAVRSKTLRSLSFWSFSKLAWATLVLSRVAVFVLLYLMLGYDVPSDVSAAYYPEAKAALDGKLVYRDFFSTYAPLFPYICAIPVKIWDSTKSLVLFTILVEMVSLPLWVSVLRTEFAARVVRTALICYVLSPLLMSSVPITGQNHVWISPFIAGTALLLQKRHDLAAGVLLGLCLVSTKFIALIFLPILWILAQRRTHFLAAFAGVFGTVNAAFWVNGADILLPVKFQRSSGQESSGNLPYVLSLFGVPSDSFLYVIAAVVLLSVTCLWLLVYRARLTRDVLLGSGFVLLFVLVLLLSKKAYTTYWASLFVPLCIVWSGQFGSRFLPLLVFLGWGVTAALEPTLYFRWVYGRDLSAIGAYRSTVFLACQAVLVGFNIAVLQSCVSAIRKGLLVAGRRCPAGC
jgi:hypothetical protein